jgi:nitrite reductase (NO-forming)
VTERLLSRRRLLQAGALGGAALLGGGLGRLGPGRAGATGDVADPHGGHLTAEGLTSTRDAAGPYGHLAAPPESLRADALDAVTYPPPFDARPPGALRTSELTVVESQREVAAGHLLDTWSYGDTVPGPVLRATQGDRLQVTVRNRTSGPHNLHLHGAHDPLMDGWEPIPPGGAFTYDVTAEPFGLHPYHCHTHPLARHVAMGLYGAMIVDPPGGRPPATEVVLVLNGWDVDGDGVNELFAWNGVAGFYDKYPIKVPVGGLVRAYVVNMVEWEPVGSFHLHSQVFDVYRTGTSLVPDERTDTVTLGQGERAIVEFRLPAAGRYLFHPHQHHMAERGATGWFAAIEE